MRRFSKVAESKYAAGHSTQLDALKAQVELTKMLNMSVELEQEKQINRSMLNALLNREAQAALGAPTDPDPGTLNLKLDELQATALARRPELRAAFLSAERAGTSLSIARSSYLPDLMLQYRWRNDPMRGNSNDAVLGFSLPLWFWKPAAMVAEAKADKEMSEADLQAMKVDTSAELATAWLRTQTAKRLADIYRTSVLPQTNEALKVAEAGYQSDRSSFLDLLDVQRSLLNFRLEYYRYLAEYEQRLAELERIAGKELSPL
jgi:cobalt-zinc-cadmium efflux system outer membrane protein